MAGRPFHVKGDPTRLKEQLVAVPLRPVDPYNITVLDRTDAELGNFFVFCVLVAGKNAMTTAAKVNAMAAEAPGGDILNALGDLSNEQLDAYLRSNKTGQYRKNRMALWQAAYLGTKWLRNASWETLDGIDGIGPKTAAFFIMHSRPDPTVAVLDRHIMRWMGEGDSTPANLARYLELSDRFIKEAAMRGLHPAELDLKVWTEMRDGTNGTEPTEA